MDAEKPCPVAAGLSINTRGGLGLSAEPPSALRKRTSQMSGEMEEKMRGRADGREESGGRVRQKARGWRGKKSRGPSRRADQRSSHRGCSFSQDEP